ncbi:craniofacial development protein 2-like [Centruroides vittatus]|uniref:craniofacial development protein 2-like n=1 Tax=Centruroides vittatus TaxID=120091 RepID=UPI00350FD066
MTGVPTHEEIFIGADINGHVGKNNASYERVHGGKGFGGRKFKGECVLQMATAYELVVVNTYFDKCEKHLITYKSRDHKSQIDYLLTRRTTLKGIKDCKVLPGEDLTSQHRLLVMELKIDLNRIKYKDKLISKIKWWLLKGKRAIEFKEKVISVINRNTKCNVSVDEWWTQVAREIRKIAKELLGETKPARKIE